jgi:hypothetical protein
VYGTTVRNGFRNRRRRTVSKEKSADAPKDDDRGRRARPPLSPPRRINDIDHVNDPSALLLQVADIVAGANDSSEMASFDALVPDRLTLLRLTRADLARVHEMTTEMLEGRFEGVAA